ncbi:MAG: pyridoxal phosphate-dependent aminotransferase [Clostridiales bacterium]|uniref:pyridoxal phosphate-dependent aminotransferase n=1 Tax=Flavonifractor porci TaxID=3133422 RepID=UPI00309C0ED9|nr:pyridoxal phosphate-dependent aminotransferase [Clostridiales bacterium]
MEFTNEVINHKILKERAYNMRWAEVEEGVIPLTAADSDFPPAPEISQAMIEYINGGYFCYTPHRGFLSFKESMAKALWERKQEPVNPNYVLPVDSAARGMWAIAQAFLKPGDEAIVFDPVDFLFKTSMEAAGAKITLYPMKLREDGTIDFSDLERYITPKTKMLGLCNPHNPLGKVYPMEDLDHILSLSEKYGFYIMNDEIWSDIVYSDAQFNSILKLGNERNARTLSVFGFSKSFGIAGLRAGCIYCPNEETFEKVVAASLTDTTIGGVDALAQVAGQACVEKAYYWVDGFVAQMQKNRDYALERISKMSGITCHKPQATFVLFPDVHEVGMDPVDLVTYLREKHKLSIVPGGEQFFGPGSAGHIRICLATSHELLEEGLNRLEKGLQEIMTNKQ